MKLNLIYSLFDLIALSSNLDKRYGNTKNEYIFIHKFKYTIIFFEKDSFASK